MEAMKVAPTIALRFIESSTFVVERATCAPSTSALSVRRRRFVARSLTDPEQGASRRIRNAPDGSSGWGNQERMQEEERVRAQRDIIQRLRLRAVIAEQLRNGPGGSRDQDAALLWEVERRLRAQATQQSDVDEIVKLLEQRLGVETSSAKKQECSIVYDYLNAWLKDWDQGLEREGQGRLQEQWEEFNEQRESQTNPSATVVELRDSSSAAGELSRSESKEEKTLALSDEPVVCLKNEANGAELYLVGTSHISKQSVLDVRGVIQKVKPDYVMVELDKKRFHNMMGRSNGRKPFPMLQHLVQKLANINIGAAGKVVYLDLFESYRRLSSRRIATGMEMRAAIEEGEKLGAQIVLGDQDFDFTLKRIGELMSVTEALQFLYRPVPKRLMDGAANNVAKRERMRNRKLVREASKMLMPPAVNKILLDERNEVMVTTLRNLSGKIVAVVGLAHLDGMEQLWREANEKHRRESTH